MKTIVLLALLLQSLPRCEFAGSTASDAGSRVVFVWERFGKAWQQFRKNPGPRMAQSVIACIPDSGHVSLADTGYGPATEKEVYDYLGTLARLMKKGHPTIVRLGFRLFYIADGDFAEELDIMLGKLILRRPALFLEALKENRKLLGPLDGLVSNLGPSFVDNFDAQRSERSRRLKALESVSEENLRVVRDECIRILSLKE